MINKLNLPWLSKKKNIKIVMGALQKRPKFAMFGIQKML